MTTANRQPSRSKKKVYLVPEYQRRRYLVHHVVEAGSRREAQRKVLDGDSAISGEQLLSTTHALIKLDEIVELPRAQEGR